MPIRAYLILHHTRLIWCGILALVFPALLAVFTASEDGLDFGVLWNHFCGCPPGKGDAFALLYGPMFIALTTAITLGLGTAVSVNTTSTATATPAVRTYITYFLTRPIRRTRLVLAPAFIATALIAVLPAFGFAVTFGWMYLVHAPALAFFPRALRLYPEVAALPANASIVSLLSAAHAPRHYLAAISFGLSAYAFFYTSRWLMLSRNGWVRFFGAMQNIFLFLIPMTIRFIGDRLAAWLYMVPSGHLLIWYPSAVNIAAHFAVPACLLYASVRIVQKADF